MRTLFPFLFLLSAPAFAQFPLNDTGETQCYNGSVLTTCMEANTGDTSTRPRQDARFGRDSRVGEGLLPKIGSGAAGFDFTKICNSGQAAGTGTCPPDPRRGPGVDDWACTRDNVTGRVWELRNRGPVRFFDASLQAANANTNQVCSFTDWRVPTRRELLSIVHSGATSSPRIDLTFFPITSTGNWYWSSNIIVGFSGFAWVMDFTDGRTRISETGFQHVLHLVRNGQ